MSKDGFSQVKRQIGIVIIVASLLVVWRLFVLYSAADDEVAGNVTVATSKEYTFETGDSTNLHFTQVTGSVVVLAGSNNKVSILATARATGVDETSARRVLQSLASEVKQNGDTITFNADKQSKPGRRLDYKVMAPAQTTVKIAAGDGDVTIAGLNGDVTAKGRNLSVSVTDLRGRIDVDIETGNLKLTDVTGAIRIRARASPVQIERVAGPSMNIMTAANITVKDGGTDADAFFHLERGDLTLNRFSAATLEATTAAGQIRLYESTAKQTTLTTRDGNINLYQVNAGKLRAETIAGHLTMDKVQGELSIKTQGGNVDLTEIAATAINVAAGTGDVLFYGTLPPEGEHRIVTTSGDILIFVGKESAFRLDAATQGEITIEPPFQVADAEQVGNHRRGVINGGMMSLVLASRTGNIRISSRQL